MNAITTRRQFLVKAATTGASIVVSGLVSRRSAFADREPVGGVLLYEDTFDTSASLKNWQVMDGTWWIEDGQLLGSSESRKFPHGDILLVDALQPFGNWQLEYDFGFLQADARYAFRQAWALASLWVKPKDRHVLCLGYGAWGWDGSPPGVIYTELAHFGPWTVRYQPYDWTPLAPGNRVAFRREGNVITMCMNGVEIDRVTWPIKGNQTIKLGLHVYGGVSVDNLRLYSLP